MAEDRRQVQLLIVEDDEDDFILTRDLLSLTSNFDFNVEWAATLEQAHEHLSRNVHQICLMDYRLGAEVGLDLVLRAADMGFTGPIIMLTGQDDAGVEIAAAEAGAADYLVKDGLGLEQLVRSIRYALARVDMQAERNERARAEAQNRAKTEFLANLSHEIRTPLTAIIGYTELLAEEYSQHTGGKLLERLEVVKRNSRHLLSLLNDTLDLSKIEAGKMEIDLGQIDLAVFIADIQSLVKASAADEGLSFSLELAPSLPARILTDPTRLRQILLNLGSNAIKFTDDGGLSLNVDYDDTRPDSLLFRISDTGVGISPDKLESIFSPFVQHSGEKALLGTGLGLTISRRLADLLGGNLGASSEPGKGSTFTLSINPGDLSDQHFTTLEIIGSKQLAGSHKLPVSIRRALVVDDVRDICELVCSILVQCQVNCESASDGAEALNLLQNAATGDFDLLIMDINMPVMDGLTTIKTLRNSDCALKDIPAVALTAANIRGEKEKCLAAGFDAFAGKPLLADALVDAINSIEITAAGSEHDMENNTAISTLIVEDHDDTRQALCDMLDLLGQPVIGTGSAAEALSALQRYPIQLVLTDVHLNAGEGAADGVDLAAEIKSRKPEVKVILVTGDQRMLNDCPPVADGVLLKPVRLADLQKYLHQDS